MLAITKGTDLYDAQPVLITDPKELVKTAGSLHCGTVLLPKLIKKYFNGARDMKLGVTVKTLRNWMWRRKLGYFKAGRVMIPESAVRAYLERSRIDPHRSAATA